ATAAPAADFWLRSTWRLRSVMTLSLPIFNPNAGRLGTLLESLCGSALCSASTGTQAANKREAGSTSEPLPMTMEEARKRNWDELDVVFVTGDAYIDHPSFEGGFWGGWWGRLEFAWRSSASRIGERSMTGGGLAARGCFSRSVRATWTR